MTRPAAAPPDARAVARIAIVWRAIAHALIDAQVTRKMYEALRRRDVNGALAAVPNFNDKNDPYAQAVAHQLISITTAELRGVFKMIADREYRRVGSGVRVAKADKLPPINRFAEVPHDDEFIAQRSAELVVDIGDEQRENIRNVLAMRFDPDVRPENIIRDIKWVVGLTDRESAAVFRREGMLREGGLPEERIQRETQRYSDNLHQLRAERIARTETVGIETEARDAAWGVAQSDGLIGKDAKKEWVASHKACPDLCRKLDGVSVPVNGGMWISPLDGKKIKGPPAHPLCVLADALISAPGVLAATKRFYEGDVVVVKTANGLELPCTPNHPILTARGWVAAGMLREGDSVLRDSSEVGAFTDDSNQHRVASVSEVFESLRHTRSVSAVEVEVAAPDFHGDGEGSEVAIVLSHRQLRRQAELRERGFARESLLKRGLSFVRSLILRGATFESIERHTATAYGGVSFLGQLFTETGISPVHQQSGFSLSSSSNTSAQKNTADDVTRHIETLRQVLLGYTADVVPTNSLLRQVLAVSARDRVVSVSSSFRRTHVFNLQTPTGYYFANGIATHNCECISVLR